MIIWSLKFMQVLNMFIFFIFIELNFIYSVAASRTQIFDFHSSHLHDIQIQMFTYCNSISGGSDFSVVCIG